MQFIHRFIHFNNPPKKYPLTWFYFRKLDFIRSKEFSKFLETVSFFDLDALEQEKAASDVLWIGFFQQALLERAYKIWKHGGTVSPHIPEWFRAKGWFVPFEWV